MMIGFALLLAAGSTAGRKLELKDVTSRSFRAETMAAVKAMPDGESYTQLSSDGKRVVKYSFKTGKEVGVLFDAETVKGDKIASVDGYVMSPDGRRMLIQTRKKAIYRRSYTADFYIFDMRNNRVTPLSQNGAQQTPVFSPDGQQIAFVRDNNIFLVKLLYDNAEVQVTKDGKQNEVINGIPDWVNEEEFSFNSAMVFTADGGQLVWIRYDESAVRQYSMQLFRGLSPQREEYADYPGFYTYKYPIAGETNASVSVWSYDIQSRRTRQLQVPVDADGYIPRVVSTSDATRVAVYTMNRHQDCLRIYMVNPLSTVSQLSVEEKVSRYVREESMSGIQITGSHILLPSDRDGNMHLYLYNLNGQLLRQVDRGDYEVSAVYGYDEKTGDTYFASHADGATDQRVWVAHENGKTECLTPKGGWSTAVFSSDYRYFIHTWSDMQTPPVYSLCTNKGKTMQVLVDNQKLRDLWSEYDQGRRELFTLTTADGVTLNGWMVKPADFDATKRYPVIMYQYGGPGNQQVKNAWQIGMAGNGAVLEQYLCQQGYVCVCVDNRGTGGRGAEFEKCTYMKLGQLEAHDQVEAALWLARQSYVDKERIGIWGWSFGGFNTLMAMSEGRGAFRAGVAIAPPTSWRYYDTIYTERFMRTPKENPTGYDDCPLARADKMQGALLICHGMADDNVHFRNTAEYTEALVQADKDFRQLVYTNRNHSIFGGNTRNHLYRQCVDHFNAALK
jgi:dipeptidyl-peptidase-4